MWGTDIAFFGFALFGIIAVYANYTISTDDTDNITIALNLAGLLCIFGMSFTYYFHRIFYVAK